MELRKYINFLWRRIFIIIIVTAVTIVVVAIGTNYITPVYQATTVIRIATSAGGALEYSDYMATDRLMNTYVEIAISQPMSKELVATLGLPEPPVLKAEIIPNTELIQITVEDTDPERAATIINTLADILIAQSSQIYIGGGKKLTDVLAEQLVQAQADVEDTQKEYDQLIVQTPAAPEKVDSTRQILTIKQTNYATLLTQYEQARFREKIQSSMITVWETADIPLKPSRPNILLNYILGVAVGLIGGISLALVFENLDTTIYTTQEIEKITNMTAFGNIPKASQEQIENTHDIFSPLSESFRNLATLIHQNDGQKPMKTMLMMSAEPSQGKSTAVLHLAHSLAEFGKKVMVIDCDTRAPRVHTLFNVPNECGLKDILEQHAALEDAVQGSSEGISVITSGSLLSNPSQLLGSPQMAKLIDQLKNKYDYILLDSPAFLAAADVTALTLSADCLMLVVRRSHAKREALHGIVRYMEDLNDKDIYLIVNQTETQTTYDYYHYQNRPKPLTTRVKNILVRTNGHNSSASDTTKN